MLHSTRSIRAALLLVLPTLGAAAIAIPQHASAQVVASSGGPGGAGPRLRAERVAPSITFRGERLDMAAPAAHRNTTIQISLLAVVVGVVLLVLLL